MYKKDRLDAATELRDAAIAVLRQHGFNTENQVVMFEPHTPDNPTPYLSIGLTNRILPGRLVLNVWATRNDKHGKVLNIDWHGNDVTLVSFRRGDWESELLAMAGAVSVH